LRKYFDPLLKQLFKKLLKGSLARQYFGKTGVMPPSSLVSMARAPVFFFHVFIFSLMNTSEKAKHYPFVYLRYVRFLN